MLASCGYVCCIANISAHKTFVRFPQKAKFFIAFTTHMHHELSIAHVIDLTVVPSHSEYTVFSQYGKVILL